MRTTSVFAFALLAACTGDRGPQGEPGDPVVDPSLPPIEKAYVAIGGKDKLLGLERFRFETTGTRYFPGEQYTPTSAPLVTNQFSSTFTYEIGEDSSRADITRTITIFGVTVPQTFSEIVVGPLGHVSGDDGLFGGSAGDLLPAGTAAIKKEQRLLNPHILLRELLAHPEQARVTGTALVDGSLHHLVEIDGEVAPITLYINAQTGRITKLVTLESDHVFRDTEITAFFAEWEATNGLAFPRQVYLATGDDIALAETRTAVEVDQPYARFELPAGANPSYSADAAAPGLVDSHFHQGFAGFGFRLDFVQSQIEATQLAPGVFRLGGGTHNSIAVEQANGIVIIEAPLYSARSQAVIAWAAAQFPTKPITHLVTTHFHDDHTGGVRDFVAIGAQIVTGAGSEGLLERAVAAPSRLVADALAEHPRPLRITRVARGQTLRLADAAHPIDIIPVDNTHAVDMVMARLPTDRVTFESDLYSPGFPPIFDPSWKQAVYNALVARNATTDTIVGGHGGVAPFSTLASEVGQ